MNLNFNAAKPRPDDNVVAYFSTSQIVEQKENICDDDGKIISTRIVRKSFTKVVPFSEFENRDLDCDLFSVENMKAAGVDLFKQQPLTAKLFGATLDQRSDVADQLDNFDYSQLTEQDFHE